MVGGSPGLWTRRQHLHSGLKRDLAIGEVDHKGGGMLRREDSGSAAGCGSACGMSCKRAVQHLRRRAKRELGQGRRRKK